MRQEVLELMKNKRSLSDCESPYYDCPDYEYYIPVVFHIVQNQADVLAYPITEAMLDMLIIELNQVFAGTHPAQTVLDPDFAPVFAGNTGIRFVRAAVDPNGDPHSGIQRRTTYKEGFRLDNYGPTDPDTEPDAINHPDIVKYEASGGLDAWPRTEFLNVWICNLIGTTAQGYATFPKWDLVRPQLSGIVLRSSMFAASTIPTMLTAHEIGHWFGLSHTFEGFCLEGCEYIYGDLCADTPRDAFSYSLCITPSYNCDNKNMNENIMDYSACQKMFTLEQLDRMRCQMSVYRGSFALTPGWPCVSVLSGVKFTPETSTAPICFGESYTVATSPHAGYTYEWEVLPAGVATFTTSSPIANVMTLTNVSYTHNDEVTIRLRMKLLEPIPGITPCGTGRWFEQKVWFGAPAVPVTTSSTIASSTPNLWKICNPQQVHTFTANAMGYPPGLVSGLTYAWVVSGGTILSGAGTNSITVKWAPSVPVGALGTIKVTTTSSCGSRSDTDVWVKECPVGGRMASLSPNPASGQVAVTLRDEIVMSPNGLQITVRDMIGSTKFFLTSFERQTTLDISSLQTGLYIVTIQNGQESEELRLVVE
ncbi:MAG: T9SS C-terminal target domain-containing protein [Cytophagales bacterium]|nr:MAG: T9SS C-terminal target domain-containing protein [Cytophagales bacterium]TAF60673.1 MAG: T9SS C-terminal target domain-containing protein [Cytophagales bacterium]